MRRSEVGTRAAMGATLFVVGGLFAVPSSTEGAPTVPLPEFSSTNRDRGSTVAYAKYDGIDGEAQDAGHDKWIDVVSIDWGAHKPGGGATGQSRRRGRVVVEDLTLTMEYEKASPKLQEQCLNGAVIPKLEIEQTATYGGARATYLKYELKNVQVTSFNVEGGGAGEAPMMKVAMNFEEVKVTYTENDSNGTSKGNIEYEWKVEKGGK